MSRRWLVMACIAAGLVLIGLGVWWAVANLDAADKLASVVGAVVGVAGLALSGYGVIQSRRGPTSAGQSVTDSTVDGQLVQVRNVRGSLRIGPVGAATPPITAATPGTHHAPPPATPSPQPVSPAAAPQPGGQAVTRSQVAGPIYQIDDVGGNVDVDQ